MGIWFSCGRIVLDNQQYGCRWNYGAVVSTFIQRSDAFALTMAAQEIWFCFLFLVSHILDSNRIPERTGRTRIPMDVHSPHAVLLSRSLAIYRLYRRLRGHVLDWNGKYCSFFVVGAGMENER